MKTLFICMLMSVSIYAKKTEFVCQSSYTKVRINDRIVELQKKGYEVNVKDFKMAMSATAHGYGPGNLQGAVKEFRNKECAVLEYLANQ